MPPGHWGSATWRGPVRKLSLLHAPAFTLDRMIHELDMRAWLSEPFGRSLIRPCCTLPTRGQIHSLPVHGFSRLSADANCAHLVGTRALEVLYGQLASTNALEIHAVLSAVRNLAIASTSESSTLP